MDSILFIMNYSIFGASRRKYDDQMNACRRLGLDVWNLGVDDDSVFLCHGAERFRLRSIIKSSLKSVAENLIYVSLYRSVPAALKFKPDFTFCYLRRYFVENSMCRALKTLTEAGAKTIIEIPTYPHNAEQSANKSLLGGFVSAVGNHFEKKASRYVSLFCPMGEDCSSILGRPALNIENGIDVTDIKLRQPDFDPDCFHIAALALMTYWHGYDRLISSLGAYRKSGGDANVMLHLIGEGDILNRWRDLAVELGVSDCVKFEGKMNNDAMNAFFDRCDIGAASLGRYRSGLSVVYELKTREYMARGLPFIYATDDRVVDAFGKYILHVPNSDAPIDMRSLIDFMRDMRTLPSAPSEMRRFARDNMSFDLQFQRVLGFFRR